MLITARVYDSEATAQQAAARLQERGIRGDLIHVFGPSQGEPAAIVKAAVASEKLPWEYRNFATRLLREGQTLVSVFPPFGSGLLTESILDEFTPRADIEFPTIRRSSPAPLSELLGLPLLSDKLTFGEPNLSNNPAPLSSRLGWGLLSSNRTPLSSMFGMKLLTKPKENWTRSFGLPLLSRPPTNKTTSFGFPMLSRNGTPLSNIFGFPLLSKDNKNPKLFDFPQLLKSPTPLSSLLRLPVLTDENFNEETDKSKREQT